MTTNPAGASALLARTELFFSVSVGGGPPNVPFQIPPPSARRVSERQLTPGAARPDAVVEHDRPLDGEIAGVRDPAALRRAAPAASATTELCAIRLSRIVTGPSTSIPPPSAAASPAAEVARTRLSVTGSCRAATGLGQHAAGEGDREGARPANVRRRAVAVHERVPDRRRDGRAPDMDPARQRHRLAGRGERPRQLGAVVADDAVLDRERAVAPMPPDCAAWPFGGAETARFPLTTLRLTTSVAAWRLKIPPALVPLAAEPIEPAVLFVTRESVIVSTPPLSIPPPVLNPHGSGPQNGPGGTAECDVTVLPVITLSVIDTVAPVPLNGGTGTARSGSRCRHRT